MGAWARGHLLAVVKIDQQRCPDAVQVSFFVGEAGAQRAAVGSVETHDGVGFLERIERRAAHIQGVVVVFAGAVLGHDAVEQALRPAG